MDPSRKLVDLARRIVEHEAGSPDPADSAAALEAACGKLTANLVDFLGSAGSSALLKRALHLAQHDRPLLAKVSVAEPGACFTGLHESLTAGTNEEASATAAAVLAHLLDLLVTLLGEELGMKPIHKLWPQHTSVRERDE
jgi:hypothetical protein